MVMELDPVCKNALVTLAEKIRMHEEEALKEMVDHTNDTDLGRLPSTIEWIT